VPATSERDRDERLREQDPRRGDRGGQQVLSKPVEAEVAGGREAIEEAAGDGDGDQRRAVVLRRHGPVEGWDLRQRHHRPEHE
jgi:hypothetical protein